VGDHKFEGIHNYGFYIDDMSRGVGDPKFEGIHNDDFFISSFCCGRP
jgi:hypothetical protein